MSKIIKITAFFLFFVICICVRNTIAAVSCSTPQEQCCKNGELSCCPDPGVDDRGIQLYYDISSCMGGDQLYDRDEGLIKTCTIGATQTKYIADVDACNYDTKTRTCCSNGSWSEWGKDCVVLPNCSSSQCWNGTICEDTPSDNGTMVTEDCAAFGISYTCNFGSGWERKRTYIHPSSSETSCWDGSSCVAKPSECNQSTTRNDCKVYTSTCTCSPKSGWTISSELTGCPSGLIVRDGACSHPGGVSIYISSEQHNASSCTTTCPFGASSMKQCGSLLYAIYSSDISSCTMCDYPYTGYFAAMNKVSRI